jgi:F-box-like
MKSGFGDSVSYGGKMNSSSVAPPLNPDNIEQAIPSHPLGVKPSGNKYTATEDARKAIGTFQILPDEILAILLEYLDSRLLRHLGSTCRALYAFCYLDDLWKSLFIE